MTKDASRIINELENIAQAMNKSAQAYERNEMPRAAAIIRHWWGEINELIKKEKRNK